MDEHKIINGNALEVLRTFSGESVDMCLTSPPYWGLRDYGVEQIFGGDPGCDHKWGAGITKKQRGAAAGATAQVGNQKKKIQGTHINQGKYCQKCQAWKGQLGLEPTPEFYIEHLTQIFREVKRVLKKEGTLWLNIGDTYWSAKGSCFNPGGGKGSFEGIAKRKEAKAYPRYRGNKADVPNLPQKCLTMIPERLAWSLIQDGWILRNKIIWKKKNYMPSSVKDRFTNSWEYIFLFSKNKKYYFDLDAVREPHNFNRWSMSNKIGSEKAKKAAPGQSKHSWQRKGIAGYYDEKGNLTVNPLGKNPGDFFELATQPFPEAHFSVFPEKLCEKPIKAGCPERVCKKCGKASEKIIEPTKEYKKHLGKSWSDHKDDAQKGKRINRKVDRSEYITTGWTPCNCGADFEGGVVLDPFCGAGTTGVVAKKLDRKFIGIDISEKFCEMARKRILKTECQLELK